MRKLTRGALAAAALVLASMPAGTAVRAAPTSEGPPLLAYYYTWFTPGSWNRAKIDYPRLGRYSSGDRQVVEQHITWAKSAGINGFIVSWKDTPVNDRRLELLMDVARRQNFKLAMIYQGLDFTRKPLPVAQVARDFATFRTRYAGDPVFYRLGGRPLTIWSGTWKYSHGDIARVTGAVRPQLLVLSTAKNVADYRRTADVTDGDAYYWSSVNPATNTNYGSKLRDMSAAAHARDQYWIAPFAPGFDARLVGGKKSVQRDDGATLRTEYGTALGSSPDVLGLISWNEFSENTYVEPSQRFGTRYLEVLRELRTTGVPQPPSAQDSSEPGGHGRARAKAYLPTFLAMGFAALLVAAPGIPALRRRRRPSG